MVFIWSEWSGRSRPPPKCHEAAPLKNAAKHPPPKNATKQLPPKKCRKEDRLKICSKCSPPQKYCEAALQKVPCYV